METMEGLQDPAGAGRRLGNEELVTSLRRDGRTTWIALAGELDAFTATKLRSALRQAEADAEEALVLDLRELTFMDSSGLAVILAAHERGSHDENADVKLLIRGSAPVEALFETIGASEYLNLIRDPSEAGETPGS